MALAGAELFPNVTDWPLCSPKQVPGKARASLGISSASLAGTKVCVPAQGSSRKECARGRDGWCKQGREGAEGGAQGHREWG